MFTSRPLAAYFLAVLTHVVASSPMSGLSQITMAALTLAASDAYAGAFGNSAPLPTGNAAKVMGNDVIVGYWNSTLGGQQVREMNE